MLESICLNTIYKDLFKEYKSQGWWPLRSRKNRKSFNKGGYHPGEKIILNNSEKFEIAVGAILTQNTNWNNAAKAIDALLENDLLHIEKLSETSAERISELIKSSGYYNQKSKKLKILSDFFQRLDGKTPERNELLGLWGVGQETADSILLYAFNLPFFVIDIYTRRILNRISGNEKVLSIGSELLRLEIQNENEFNIETMQEYHALFVYHAKKYCQKIPKCLNCPLNSICNYYKVIEI